MTNREWLSTLTDEDFTRWCTSGLTMIQARIENDQIKITSEIPMYYPTMQDVFGSNVGSRYSILLNWMCARHKTSINSLKIEEEK